MIIVDTSIWIDFFKGTENNFTYWLDQRLDQEPIGLTDLILCEYLQGFPSNATFSAALRELSKFEIFNSGGEETAIAAARNYRKLRDLGCTVRKTIDCVIASFCIGGGHTLLHRDRDFDPFEKHLGLRVVHPRLH